MQSNTSKEMYALCEQNMNEHVLVNLVDGVEIDGILIGLDDQTITLATETNEQLGDVRTNLRELEDQSDHVRNFYGGRPQYHYYGRPPYYEPYGYGYYPGGRPLQQLILPIAAIAALSTLSFYR